MRESSTWTWPVLHDAQRVVLLDVVRNGSRSRADLARRTGMSRASLSRLSRDLIDLGLLEEGQTIAGPGRGRPAETLRIIPSSAHFAGIKLTGDALYAVVTDLAAQELATVERPLPSRAVDDVVALIADAVAELREDYPRISAVGVCLAGDIATGAGGERRIIGSHFLGWEDVPLARLVHSKTGHPTEIGNDVQSLTAAHHWFGTGRGSTSLALIGFGAGIGAGIVVNDQLIHGSRGHPGKVGHLRVTDTGPQCDRGHVGCVSAYATIPAMQRNAGGLPFEEILARADRADPEAVRVLEGAVRALGVVVADLISIADVERVIITGEGLAIAERSSALLQSVVAQALDPAAEMPPILLHPFRFADYAWAAAVSAIRLVL